MPWVLSANAFVRSYVGDAGRGWVVQLRAPGRRRWIDAETRRYLALCDGWRSVEEIARLAGDELGRDVAPARVEAALEPLVELGALVEPGSEPPRRKPPLRERGIVVIELDEERAAKIEIATVPGVGFDCDGRGACCSQYERLLLGPADVIQIRRAFGDGLTPGGLSVDAVVQRHRDEDPDELYELAVVDGACALREADGRCGVHARLGAEAKPDNCQAYPMRDVLCGSTLAVGLAVECRCVVDFAAGPPIDAAARATLERRRAARIVEAVNDEVPFTLARPVPRDEYVRWRARATAALGGAPDPIAWALEEAIALVAPPRRADDSHHSHESNESNETRESHETLDSRASLGSLARALSPLHDELGALFAADAASTAEVYSRADPQRLAFAWARDSFSHYRAAPDQPRPPQSGERLLAAQLLHTHGLLRARTLAVGLYGLALRLGLARASSGHLPPRLLPVTTVEYLHRSQFFGRVLDAHAAAIEAALAVTRGA